MKARSENRRRGRGIGVASGERSVSAPPQGPVLDESIRECREPLVLCGSLVIKMAKRERERERDGEH